MIQPTPAMTAMPKNSSENLVRMTRHGNGPSIFPFMHGGVLMFGDAARKDPDTGRFLFTAFAVLGVMGPAMFGFGAAVSTDREQGLLKLNARCRRHRHRNCWPRGSWRRCLPPSS